MDIKEIFDRQFERTYRTAMIYLKNPADAEDAAQTVFLKLIEKQPEFSDENHEKAWFIRTASNLCKDMLRSSFRSKVDLGEIPEQTYEDGGSEALSALMSLPSKYREVLYMYYYEGYTTQEIGEMLGRKPSTVQSQLAAGRQKLKDKLIEEELIYG